MFVEVIERSLWWEGSLGLEEGWLDFGGHRTVEVLDQRVPRVFWVEEF